MPKRTFTRPSPALIARNRQALAQGELARQHRAANETTTKPVVTPATPAPAARTQEDATVTDQTLKA